MEIVDALLNRSEHATFRELEGIAADNGLRLFSKTRLSDVIAKGSTRLSQREFDYYTRCHCDFVLTDAAFRPQMIVEYDGPLHADVVQQARDRIKNHLCRSAGMGLLRINDRHVTKLYRGMTVLRWIIEVSGLSRVFDEAQRAGHIPADEPFDPAFFITGSGGQRFPYWLSAPATQSFHDFFATLGAGAEYGWSSFLGRDADGTAYRLSCLYFDDRILWARTAVRRQDLDFPHYDLLTEIDTCELGLQLEKYRRGEIPGASKDEFRQVFDRFCGCYDPYPTHWMGAFPFPGKWDLSNGWRTMA